jgi:hypothetical protein
VAAGANTEMKGLAAQLVHRTQQLPQAKPWNDPRKPPVNNHAKHSVPQYSYQVGPQLQQTIAFPHHAGASILQPVSAANAATLSDRKRTPRRTVRELVCRGRGAQGIVCTKVAHTRGGRATRMEHWSHSDCCACNAQKLPLSHPKMEPCSPHLKWGYLPEQ